MSGIDSGVETYIYPASKATDAIPESEKVDVASSIVFEFRWRGDFKEAATVFYIAQALTVKYNGVAFDPQSGIFLESEQIAQGADAFANLSE